MLLGLPKVRVEKVSLDIPHLHLVSVISLDEVIKTCAYAGVIDPARLEGVSF